jgi:hypothetical protein
MDVACGGEPVTAIAPYVRPSTTNSFYRLLGSSNLWGV